MTGVDQEKFYIVFYYGELYLCKNFVDDNNGKKVYNICDTTYESGDGNGDDDNNTKEEDKQVNMGMYGFDYSGNEEAFHELVYDTVIKECIKCLQQDTNNKEHKQALTGMLIGCYPEYFKRYKLHKLQTQCQKMYVVLSVSDEIHLCEKVSNDTDVSERYKSVFDCIDVCYDSWNEFNDKGNDGYHIIDSERVSDTNIMNIINILSSDDIKYTQHYKNLLAAIIKTVCPNCFETRDERLRERQLKYEQRTYSSDY